MLSWSSDNPSFYGCGAGALPVEPTTVPQEVAAKTTDEYGLPVGPLHT